MKLLFLQNWHRTSLWLKQTALFKSFSNKQLNAPLNRKFSIQFGMLIFMFICNLFSTTLSACDPEPGSQHFPVTPGPPAPIIKAGIFEIHNEINGLPSNRILSVLMLQDCVLAGSEDKGLLIYDGTNWAAFNQTLNHNFPSDCVSCLYKTSEKSALAGTPVGVVEIKFGEKPHAPDFNLIASSPDKNNVNVLDIGMADDKSAAINIAGDRVAGTLQGSEITPFSWSGSIAPTGFSSVLAQEDKTYFGCSLGLFEVTSGSLVQVNLSSDPGWVTDIKDNGKEIYFTSSNGVYRLPDSGELQPVLPGIWSECLGISDKPLFSGQNLESIGISISSASSVINLSDSDREKLAGLEEVSQLHSQLSEFQSLIIATYQNDVPPQVMDDYWNRFNTVVEEMRKLMPQGEAIILRVPLKKGLWVGTRNNGLVLFGSDGKNYHMTHDNSKLPSDNLSAISVASNGEGWFATRDAGLMHYVQRIHPSADDLKVLQACSPTRIRIFGSQLFIGTKDQGLIVFNANDLKKDLHLQNSLTFDFHECVNDFCLDSQGRLWVTGNKGLMCLNNGKWQKIKFLSQEPPLTAPDRIEVDNDGKVFVAFPSSNELSKQIWFYNGDSLENLDKQKITQILQLPEKDQKVMMEFFGLKGSYQRSFDEKIASETIKTFDQCPISPVTAILNLPNYLQIGTESGMQAIFDGENFKPLSEKGTGNPGKILNFKRLPENRILIQGEDKMSLFDGEHYHPIVHPAPGTGKMTDLAEDSENPQTFWVSYSSATDGGIAVFSDPYWETTDLPLPISSLAISSSYFFVASPEGVHYLPRK